MCQARRPEARRPPSMAAPARRGRDFPHRIPPTEPRSSRALACRRSLTPAPRESTHAARLSADGHVTPSGTRARSSTRHPQRWERRAGCHIRWQPKDTDTATARPAPPDKGPPRRARLPAVRPSSFSCSHWRDSGPASARPEVRLHSRAAGLFLESRPAGQRPAGSQRTPEASTAVSPRPRHALGASGAQRPSRSTRLSADDCAAPKGPAATWHVGRPVVRDPAAPSGLSAGRAGSGAGSERSSCRHGSPALTRLLCAEPGLSGETGGLAPATGDPAPGSRPAHPPDRCACSLSRTSLSKSVSPAALHTDTVSVSVARTCGTSVTFHSKGYPRKRSPGLRRVRPASRRDAWSGLAWGPGRLETARLQCGTSPRLGPHTRPVRGRPLLWRTC